MDDHPTLRRLQSIRDRFRRAGGIQSQDFAWIAEELEFWLTECVAEKQTSEDRRKVLMAMSERDSEGLMRAFDDAIVTPLLHGRKTEE